MTHRSQRIRKIIFAGPKKVVDAVEILRARAGGRVEQATSYSVFEITDCPFHASQRRLMFFQNRGDADGARERGHQNVSFPPLGDSQSRKVDDVYGDFVAKVF